MTGGTVTATNNALYATGNATITIGTNDGTVSKDTPKVTSTATSGDYYGVYRGDTATYNFYDGIITGYDGHSLNAQESSKPDGYQVVKRTADGKETAVLEKEITVTAEAGDGAISATDGWTLAQDGKTATKKVLQNTPYGTLPTKDEMERTGYTFKGWHGKNLLKLDVLQSTPSNTTYANTTKRVFTNGTYVKGLAFNNYYQPSNVGNYTIESNSLTLTASNGYGIGYPMLCTPGKTYTVSCDATINTNNSSYAKTVVGIQFYKVDGTQIAQEYVTTDGNAKVTKVAPSDAYYIVVTLGANGTNINITYTNIQVEEGSTATAYEPYTVIDANTILKTAGDHKIYANWTANNYLVTADANGGTIASTTGWTGTGATATKTITYDSTYGTLPTPTRTGYDFAGWRGKNLLEKDIIYVDDTEDKTLNDTFFIKAGVYSLKFENITNATNWRLAVCLKDKDGNNLSDNTYRPFNGYYNTSNKAWLDNDNYSKKSYTITIKEDCYIRFYIQYGDTSASTTVSNAQLEAGSTATAYEPYGTIIDANSIVKTDGNHKIYANWTPKQYTVTADANNGTIASTQGWTGTGATATKTVTYDSAYGTLPNVSRTGYTFKGWGENIYHKDSLEKTSASNSNYDAAIYYYNFNYHTLFAGDKYFVTIGNVEFLQGSTSEISVLVYDYTDTKVLKVAEKQKDYVYSITMPENVDLTHNICLLVYNGKSGYTGGNQIRFTNVNIYRTIENTTKVKTAKDHTITALWEANPYTVTLNAGELGTIKDDAAGWTRAQDNKTATKDIIYDGAYGTLPTASRPGYNFDGWFTAATGGTQVTDSSIMQTAGAQSLFAHWTAKPYTITYNLDGGTNNSQNPATYTIESNAITLQDPTRANYVFTGWTGNGTTTPTKNIVLPHGSTEDKTYTANWEEANFSVEKDGEAYYYLKLEDAIAKAEDVDANVVVEKTCIDTSQPFEVTEDITINTDGKNVTMPNTMSVSSGKTLTISGNGTITKTSGNLITNSGTVTVDGATIETTGVAITGGNITVSSGTITSTNGTAIELTDPSSTLNFYGGKIASKTTATTRGVPTAFSVAGTVNYPAGYGAHTEQNSSTTLYETTLVQPTLTLAPTTMYLGVGTNNTGAITVTQTNCGNITYTSSDPTIAQVNASTGAVTAVKYGTVTITATDSNSGRTATITVKVDNVAPTWTITVKSIT